MFSLLNLFTYYILPYNKNFAIVILNKVLQCDEKFVIFLTNNLYLGVEK